MVDESDIPIGTEFWHEDTKPPSKWRVTERRVPTSIHACDYRIERISEEPASYLKLTDYKDDWAARVFFRNSYITIDYATVYGWWKQ